MNYLTLVLMGISVSSCSSGINLSAEMKITEGNESIELDVSNQSTGK